MLRMKFYEGMYSQNFLALTNLPLALSLQISIKQGVFILYFDNDLQGNGSSCPL